MQVMESARHGFKHNRRSMTSLLLLLLFFFCFQVYSDGYSFYYWSWISKKIGASLFPMISIPHGVNL